MIGKCTEQRFTKGEKLVKKHYKTNIS